MSADDLEGEDIWGDAPAASQNPSEEAKHEEPPADTLDDDDTRHMSISELRQRIHLINNDIRVMKSDVQRINHESRGQRERIKENQEKVKLNKQLPYLVANVVEVLEPDAEDGEFVSSLVSFFVSATIFHFVLRFFFAIFIFDKKLQGLMRKKRKQEMLPMWMLIVKHDPL
jgi:ATP-dependent 26S proteasome regulatory subunit